MSPEAQYLLTFAMVSQSQIDSNMNEWKERILKEWRKSKHYPRKKKKQVRKELNLDWSIANWEPEFSF